MKLGIVVEHQQKRIFICNITQKNHICFVIFADAMVNPCLNNTCVEKNAMCVNMPGGQSKCVCADDHVKNKDVCVSVKPKFDQCKNYCQHNGTCTKRKNGGELKCV